MVSAIVCSIAGANVASLRFQPVCYLCNQPYIFMRMADESPILVAPYFSLRSMALRISLSIGSILAASAASPIDEAN